MADGGLSDTLQGAGAVLGAGGILGFIKWLWNKREGTVTRLEKRVAALEEELRDVWLAFAHVTAALKQHDPESDALKLAGRLLKQKFPLDFDTPADMRDKLKRMP